VYLAYADTLVFRCTCAGICASFACLSLSAYKSARACVCIGVCVLLQPPVPRFLVQTLWHVYTVSLASCLTLVLVLVPVLKISSRSLLSPFFPLKRYCRSTLQTCPPNLQERPCVAEGCRLAKWKHILLDHHSFLISHNSQLRCCL
jgi:hypothetical protein